MANARHDENQVETTIALSNVDGLALVLVKADPTTHALIFADGTTGSDFGATRALRDQNGVPSFLAVSSADGITPVAVYADPSTGKMLVKST